MYCTMYIYITYKEQHTVVCTDGHHTTEVKQPYTQKANPATKTAG